MVLESNKKTKFYDNKNDIFLSLEKFSYSLNLEELKGEKIILVKDYKKPNKILKGIIHIHTLLQNGIK